MDSGMLLIWLATAENVRRLFKWHMVSGRCVSRLWSSMNVFSAGMCQMLWKRGDRLASSTPQHRARWHTLGMSTMRLKETSSVSKAMKVFHMSMCGGIVHIVSPGAKSGQRRSTAREGGCTRTTLHVHVVNLRLCRGVVHKHVPAAHSWFRLLLIVFRNGSWFFDSSGECLCRGHSSHCGTQYRT